MVDDEAAYIMVDDDEAARVAEDIDISDAMLCSNSNSSGSGSHFTVL